MKVKLERINVSDRVIDWLTDAIRSGHYKAGEQLPPLDQLSRELGVGRSSIREALRHLQAKGFIELHQGRGTFVTNRKVPLGSFATSFTNSVRERGSRSWDWYWRFSSQRY